MPPSLLVFDLDGTLLDSMGGLAACAVHVLTEHYDISQLDAHRAYLTTSGIPFFAQLELLYPNDPRNSKANIEFTALKKKSYTSWQFFDGVIEALTLLRKRGYVIAVSSNSENTLVQKLVARPVIAPLVNCALGWRPNFVKGPLHFNNLASRFNVSLNDIVFIGDSVWDAKLAAQSSVSFIAKIGTLSERSFKEYDADILTIHHIRELEAALTTWSPSYSPQVAANA